MHPRIPDNSRASFRHDARKPPARSYELAASARSLPLSPSSSLSLLRFPPTRLVELRKLPLGVAVASQPFNHRYRSRSRGKLICITALSLIWFRRQRSTVVNREDSRQRKKRYTNYIPLYIHPYLRKVTFFVETNNGHPFY